MSLPAYPGVKRMTGLTLIELLVTLILMSLVLGVATVSLSQFSRYSDKSGRSFSVQVSELLEMERLNESLEKSLDYYIRANQTTNSLYFVGEEQEIKFVSTTSWLQGEKTSINFLTIEQDPNDDNLLSMVLYQQMLSDSVFYEEGQLPDKESMQAFVILTGIRDISFDYLGIKDVRQLFLNNEGNNYQRNLRWDSRYSALQTGYLPDKIRINIQWPDGRQWPCIIRVRAMNQAKRSLMLDGAI